MVDNQYIKVYIFGFSYHDIFFCWEKKELYRMPYVRNLRGYSKRKIKPKKQGNSIGYSIDGDFKSMKTIKEITTKIDFKEEIILTSGCPF